MGHVGWGASYRGGVGHAGVGGSCRGGVGWSGSCRGGVGHAGVGWVLQGWGGSCRGGELYIVIIVLSTCQCIYDYAVDLDPSLCQKAHARD